MFLEIGNFRWEWKNSGLKRNWERRKESKVGESLEGKGREGQKQRPMLIRLLEWARARAETWQSSKLKLEQHGRTCGRLSWQREAVEETNCIAFLILSSCVGVNLFSSNFLPCFFSVYSPKRLARRWVVSSPCLITDFLLASFSESSLTCMFFTRFPILDVARCVRFSW